MPSVKHLINHWQIFENKRQPLFFLSFMMLFWGVFDGLMSYVAPLVITESGLSKILMGAVIGVSSISGAFFDFVICRIFKTPFFRRIFLVMFLFCFIYPLLLFKAHTLFLFIVAMAIWGIYFDLRNFGNFDFVSRFTAKKESSSGFGMVMAFSVLGYLLAAIFAGFLIGDSVDGTPFFVAWIFLLISFFCFLALIFITRKNKKNIEPPEIGGNCVLYNRGIFSELKVWQKLNRPLFPVLLLSLFLNVISAFVWTIGPFYIEIFSSSFRHFSGLFVAAYLLPSLLVGWLVGDLTKKFGKKKSAFLALLLGSIILTFINFLNQPILIILDVFLASTFFAISWPAISAAFTDYISETRSYEKEITGLQDFYTNIGYVIGPLCAGFLAEFIGNSGAFFILGLAGILVATLLLIFTPEKITLRKV